MATHPDLVELGASFAPPAPPAKGGKTKLVLAIGAVVVLIAAAAAVWWLVDSTVPTSDYDDVVAELEAADAELATLRADTDQEIAALNDQVAELDDRVAELNDENESLSDQLAYSRSRVDELTGVNGELRTTLAQATSLAEALAYWELNLAPEWYAELRALGVDTTEFDDLLAQLGRSETMDQLMESGDGWYLANRAVISVGDDALIDAWTRWSQAEMGSDEEIVALQSFFLRLTALMHETVATSGAGPDTAGNEIEALTGEG